jgi:hypothetical protein
MAPNTMPLGVVPLEISRRCKPDLARYIASPLRN